MPAATTPSPAVNPAPAPREVQEQDAPATPPAPPAPARLPELPTPPAPQKGKDTP
jgi:hypothetical protein